MTGGGTGSGAIARTAVGPVPRTVAVDRIATGGHACLYFDSHDDRWAVRAAFTTVGLARGERVMIFTDPDTSAPDALERLAAHGVPAERCSRTGQLTVSSLSPGYDPVRRSFDADARIAFWAAGAAEARRLGFTAVRAVGDMAWVDHAGLSGAELAAYEARLTPLFGRMGFTAICEYDRRLFAEPLLAEAAAVHPLSVLPSVDALHAARTGAALLLTGSADLATRTDFDLALRTGVVGVVLVDLTGLSFLDAHCARTVLRLRGVTVRCTAAQYRVLHVCGAGDAERIDFQVVG